MLLKPQNPAEAYRRIEVEARVRSADQGELVNLCIERVGDGVGAALRAHQAGDPVRRSTGLTGAYAALTALEMGVDRGAPIADALLQLYGAARQTILACVTDFDGVALAQIRDDFREIGSALVQSAADAPEFAG